MDDITEKEVPGYKTKVMADALKKWGVNELDNVLLITKARNCHTRTHTRPPCPSPARRPPPTARRLPAHPPQERIATVEGSARNIGNLVHSPVSSLNVYDVLRADKLFVEASALEHLNSWFGAEARCAPPAPLRPRRALLKEAAAGGCLALDGGGRPSSAAPGTTRRCADLESPPAPRARRARLGSRRQHRCPTMTTRWWSIAKAPCPRE